MRILISSDGSTAHYFIRLGLARTFTTLGHEVIMWDIHQKPVFDAFDEFQPDIFIGQTYNVNDAVIKCISERPHLKVLMKASDHGPQNLTLDRTKYPVLQVQEKELMLMQRLFKETRKPDYLYVHHHPDWLEQTHGYWVRDGFVVRSMLNAADVFEFTHGKKLPEFESDLTFIGGYWGYKSKVLDKWLIPLCNDNYRIKIFGNQPWPVSQYCGQLDGQLTRDALASATICPNLSEPHSQDLGYDIIERPFKLMSNKCFMIADYVEGMSRLFSEDEVVMAKSPEEFHKLVDHYLANPDERKSFIEKAYSRVIKEHTYFNRVYDIFDRLNLKEEAFKTKAQTPVIMKQLNL